MDSGLRNGLEVAVMECHREIVVRPEGHDRGRRANHLSSSLRDDFVFQKSNGYGRRRRVAVEPSLEGLIIRLHLRSRDGEHLDEYAVVVPYYVLNDVAPTRYF